MKKLLLLTKVALLALAGLMLFSFTSLAGGELIETDVVTIAVPTAPAPQSPPPIKTIEQPPAEQLFLINNPIVAEEPAHAKESEIAPEPLTSDALEELLPTVEPIPMPEEPEALEAARVFDAGDVSIVASTPHIALLLSDDGIVELLSDFTITLTITNSAQCGIAVRCTPNYGDNNVFYQAIGAEFGEVRLGDVGANETVVRELRLISPSNLPITIDKALRIPSTDQHSSFTLNITYEPIFE